MKINLLLILILIPWLLPQANLFFPVLQAAKKGFAQALVGQDFRKMGEVTVTYLVRSIKGLPVPGEYIDTGLELADQSNYDKFLKTKKPWEMK